MLKNYRKLSSEKDSYSEYFQKIFSSLKFIYPIVLKDIKTKFSYTYIGFLWTIIAPFFNVLLYIIFFGYVFQMPTEGSSYILFVLTGFTGWNIFSNIVQQSGAALQQNQEIVKKINLPKIIIPISKAITVFIENLTFIVVTIFAVLVRGNVHFNQIVFLPIIILGLIIFSTSLGLLICALTIYKRDLLHGLSLIMQVLIWFTPVFYPLKILPDSLSTIVSINPITGYIELIRWSLGIVENLNLNSFIGVFISVIISILAFGFFKSKEDIIIDYL